MHIDQNFCRIDYGSWNCCVNYIFKDNQRLFLLTSCFSLHSKNLLIFGSAGSWLLAFSSCREQELLSICGVWASHWNGFSFCIDWALKLEGFSSCGAWAQELQHVGFRVSGLQSLWNTGLVALRHVESSQIGNQTCVPCIGRQILNYLTTREVPIYTLNCSV